MFQLTSALNLAFLLLLLRCSQMDADVTAAQLQVAQDGPREVYSAAGESITYTSTVPSALHETLVIKNLSGRTVRTILKNVHREKGSYSDWWDGKDDAGRLVPDGPYFYVAIATTGSKTVMWDLTNETDPPVWWLIPDGKPTAPDPLNNTPMTMAYRFDHPGKMTIRLRPASAGGPLDDCSPPRYCLAKDEYTTSGSKLLVWGGADENGVYRQDFALIDVALNSSLPKNCVIVYGTKPTVENVKVMPPLYMPAKGKQAVTFDLTTYQNQPVTVKISFLNQASRSVLRTITAKNVVPGTVSIPWNGRADNGAKVAPGIYTVNVAVEDSIGNHATGQILTRVAY